MSMKFASLYRIMLAFAVLMTVPTQEADAQLLKRLFGRSASRAGSRAAARTTRELAQEMSEKSAREWAESRLSRTGARAVVDRSTERAMKEFQQESVEKVMREEVDRLAREALENASRKGLKTTVSREMSSTGRESGRSTVQEHLIDLSQQAVRAKLGEVLLRQIRNNEADRLFTTPRAITTVHRVDSLLGRRADMIWRGMVSNSNSAATKLLVDDARRDRNLRKAFQRDPDLLKIYRQMGNSPYRKDLNLLRYFNYGAGKYARAYPEIKNRWGLGNDLVIRLEDGTNYIYSGSGALLASISGDEEQGYVIRCSSQNRTMLNLYPLGNALYTCDGNVWRTDRFGRVVHAFTERSGRSAVNARHDPQLMRSVLAIKSGMGASGDAVAESVKHLNDEAGHIIGLSIGGTNDLINLVCQHRSLNRKFLFIESEEYFWHSSEESLARNLERGKTIQREIHLIYNGRNSLRPDNFEVIQTVSGRYDVLPLKRNGNIVTVDGVKVNNL